MGLLKNISKAGKKLQKKVVKKAVSSQAKALSKAASAAGLDPVANAINKANAEAQRGVDKYGDAATDTALNVGTGGAYGAAMYGDQFLSDPSSA
jgi:hypothetical protein